MKELNKFTYSLLLLFLISPVIAHVFKSFFYSRSITFYFQIFFFIYGFIFIFIAYINKQKLEIPKAIYYLLAYVLFLIIWDFGNGNLERRGIY